MSEKFKYPYVITVPGYIEASFGIQVVHKLCHLINESGGEAYIVSPETNPEWNTPKLTSGQFNEYKSSGKVFIAVYPEIESGNPLEAPICVRYMLNREGVLNGNDINAGEDDLFFFYRQEFAENEANVNLLTISTYDLSVFCDDVKEKDLDLLYLNRVPRSCVDFSALPENIKILSMEQPLSLNELAKVLKRGRVMYSYEASGTCVLAGLCGCPVVAKTAVGYEKYAITDKTSKDINNADFAWNDTPHELDRVRANLYKFRHFYEGLDSVSNQHVLSFLNITQNEAQNYYNKNCKENVMEWTEQRKLSPERIAIMSKSINELVSPQVIYVCIYDQSTSWHEILITLESLLPVKKMYSMLNCIVFTDGEYVLSKDFEPWVSLCETKELSSTIKNMAMQQHFDWIQYVRAGVTFIADGFFSAMLHLNKNGGESTVYPDKMYVNDNGELETAFLPDFSTDYFLGFPSAFFVGCFFHQSIFRDENFYNDIPPDFFDFDVLMWVFTEKGNGSISHFSEPLLISESKKELDSGKAEQLVRKYLSDKGYVNSLIFHNSSGGCRIIYDHKKELPKVSIVIVDNGDVNILQRCVMGLLEKSKYTKYEIFILSCYAEVEENRYWLEEVSKIDPKRIKVILFPHQENRLSLNNIAANQASGDYLLFLDVAVFPAHDEWLENLVNHCLRDEVGCVGSKVINLNEKIYSAGIVLGLNGVAGSPFVGSHYSASGYMHRLAIEQNYSALPLLCLLIRRSIYQDVGGVDESLTEGCLADVDLGLKIREAGYLAVWTPYSIVATDLSPEENSKNKEIFSEQEKAIYYKWGSLIDNDPSYNKNLSLTKNYKLEKHIRPYGPSLEPQRLPRVTIFSGGCNRMGIYRLEEPFYKMRYDGMIDGAVASESLIMSDFLQIEPDIIITQNSIKSGKITNFKSMRNCFSIYDMNYYESSRFDDSKNKKDYLKRIKEELASFDRVIVGSEVLAEQYNRIHHDIRIVPTYLPRFWNDLVITEKTYEKPRVGCVMQDLSDEDIELVSNVIRDFSHLVTWVFLGAYPSKLKPFIHEYHRYRGFTHYPQQLASLNLDFAIAPLVDNNVNRSRSNIRLLEFGICGIPVICSDVLCYKGSLSVSFVKNRYKDWSTAMSQYIHDVDSVRKVGALLKNQVQENWMLNQKNLETINKNWLQR
ncbi:glycosyltransferase family 2 protein [Pectobacterium versatile]|uniref:glycosyltransferase family 2 protein n=1 Tax=Pectobacterium versatile TaxID=2488639 RepID=UPI00102F23D8|nr:glycosyltransferase family 2 protein [Pectobacterium versatile]MBN3196859.1 glycosyltransferase family 2 protein [Pectobacterium versatile]TAI98567.1 glycosyltransferase family 2 protein [Pectobacterium versatile]